MGIGSGLNKNKDEAEMKRLARCNIDGMTGYK